MRYLRKFRGLWLVVLAGLVMMTMSACSSGGSSPTTPVISVTGQWTLIYDWDCNGDTGTAGWAINADNTFVTIENDPAQGTWNLRDTAITLIYDSGTVYNGTVDAAGSSMQGTMLDFNNATGCWTATRASN